MHEFFLARTVLNKVEELKNQFGFRIVTTVTVEIGRFSNVAPDLLASAFEFAKANTCAAFADLIIEDTRGNLMCESCGEEYFPDIPVAVCPRCGELSGKIIQGRELILKTLEVDDENSSD